MFKCANRKMFKWKIIENIRKSKWERWQDLSGLHPHQRNVVIFHQPFEPPIAVYHHLRINSDNSNELRAVWLLDKIPKWNGKPQDQLASPSCLPSVQIPKSTPLHVFEALGNLQGIPCFGFWMLALAISLLGISTNETENRQVGHGEWYRLHLFDVIEDTGINSSFGRETFGPITFYSISLEGCFWPHHRLQQRKPKTGVHGCCRCWRHGTRDDRAIVRILLSSFTT